MLWTDCRKLVSPPLSPPAHPWPSAGRGAGRPAASVCPPCTPCLLAAIPICPPRGRPMRPSRTHGGRGRTLQRPHPPWPRHSRVGFLLWLDMCENNIIGRADNHYFREISFFAMARCVNAPSCSPKQRKGAGARPQAAVHLPPSAVWGAGRCVPPAPPSGGGRGRLVLVRMAAVH